MYVAIEKRAFCRRQRVEGVGSAGHDLSVGSPEICSLMTGDNTRSCTFKNDFFHIGFCTTGCMAGVIREGLRWSVYSSP